MSILRRVMTRLHDLSGRIDTDELNRVALAEAMSLLSKSEQRYVAAQVLRHQRRSWQISERFAAASRAHYAARSAS